MILRIGKPIFLLALSTASSVARDSEATEDRRARSRQRSTAVASSSSATAGGGDDRVLCRVAQVDVEWHPEEEGFLEQGGDGDGDRGGPSFVCWTDNGAVLDLKPSLPIQAKELALVQGRDAVITQVVVDPSPGSPVVWLTPDSDILPYEEGGGGGLRARRKQRQLAPKEGTRQVLVARVTYLGTAPVVTASQLAGRVFGLGPSAEANNLASQAYACSFGRLTLEAGTGAGVVNGVLEVSISTPVSGDASARSLENLVQTAVAGLLGSTSAYEHVVMVYPSHPDIQSSGRSFLAYGYVGGSRTVFTDEWAGRLTALLHEIGHNWNLNHSGKGSDRYGDMSGLMGYGSRTIGGPPTCYNAQKHWELGWLAAKSRSLSAGTSDLPWVGNLAPFVDLPQAKSNQFVLLRVLGSSQRLFIQFNRKKGINSGTRELGDQVVIVQDDGTDNQVGRQSWQLGGIIAAGSTFRRAGFSGGHDLVVQVCSRDTASSPEFVRLSIYLDNGSQTSACSAGTPIAASCSEAPQTKFFVKAKNEVRTCIWLQRRPKWQAALCNKGNEAYDACPQTCKAEC